MAVAVALLVGDASGAWTLAKTSPRRGADPDALYALYSVDFEEAEESFRRMTAESPKDPEAWNLLASALWLQIVFRQEKLNLDSFTGDALGTEDSTEVVSEEEEAALRRTLDRAMEAAEAILDQDPDNLEVLYQLGVSYGTLSTFEAIGKKSYLAANRAGKKARELHMQVLEADPGFADARLTVGAYDYAVGVIPLALRLVLGVFGIRGDKEEGMEQLEYAARLGDRAAVNAKMVLVVVYNREKQYDRALPLLEELHAAYPRNYLIEVAMGGVYERTKAWPDAIATYRSVLDKMDTGVDDYDRFEPEPVLFRLAETYLQASRFREAIPRYEELIADPDSGDGLRCRSHMRAGRLLQDELRQSEAAAEHFNAIQNLPCSRDLKREARRAL